MQVRDLFLSAHLPVEQVRRFLSEYGLKQPDQADLHLQRIADAVGPRERFLGFASALFQCVPKAADSDAALLHLDAFVEAMPSAANLILYLEENPKALQSLCRILGASPYLTQLLVRNPESFYWLLENDRLERIQPASYFDEQALQFTAPLETSDRALEALRRFRRRENLRIATQDILGIGALEGTLRQVSYLADAVLKQVFAILSRELLPSPTGFAVLALGKLGGEELNFSSDIDLLYVYEDESSRERMLHFAREYTHALTAYTNEGHLYRVDLRLRPLGRDGDIAYSLKACRQYYETWADTSDRLALIKCRFAAGDFRLGNHFVAGVEDFVYKKYLDSAAVEEVRWLKKRMNAQLRRSPRAEGNIKLGSGGIREIEFFVQAFQLLYGGRLPEIRHTSTLVALENLLRQDVITLDDYRVLRPAYTFLRNLEHKLQLVHDQQTHTLPEDETELWLCARRMGYGSRADPLREFNAEVSRHTRAVRRIYDSLFETGSRLKGPEKILLDPELSREQAIEMLEKQGSPEAAQVYEGLKMLEQTPSFPHSPSRTRNLLANLTPQLVRASRMARNPRFLFARLDRFCDSLGSRATLYAELIENPEFGRKLLITLASGDFLSETLIRNPELADAVLGEGQSLLSHRELARVVETESTRGRSTKEALRLFKRREEFKVALEDLLGPRTPQARKKLTRLAQICIEFAWRQVLIRLPALKTERFTLLGLGKIGGEELTYHSDLDLVLVYEPRSESPTLRLVSRFLKEFRDELELYTEIGRAYTVDLRLRPEGRPGPLAISREMLEGYFASRAQPWERLAYVKARPLVSQGEDLWADSLVYRGPLSMSDLEQLNHIRTRKELEIGQEEKSARYNFKVGRGGLMDIQFILQYLQLQHSIPEPNTRRALKQVIAAGHLDDASGQTLQKALEFLSSLETMQRLLEEKSTNTFSRDPDEAGHLARFLGYESAQALLERYRSETGQIRRLYQRVFSTSPDRT